VNNKVNSFAFWGELSLCIESPFVEKSSMNIQQSNKIAK